MAGDGYAKFKNDRGVPEIRIGVKEFKCAGASAPQDHPHVYLNMGAADTILCPYCATSFRCDPRLGPHEADPPDSIFMDDLEQ
ncbi:zinc-finger domain-containing protein [Aurantimonas sp. A3-2-R12]|uniref:zinc-finger domain-containing protein n=1 Tax=Aurantimonas sp. A3-2-R12 TaxID=3114362 RepID=UPI002E17BD59|nr:zinc-finger domain-containing protein [Aurantimonas sp. A3-2-R12]